MEELIFNPVIYAVAGLVLSALYLFFSFLKERRLHRSGVRTEATVVKRYRREQDGFDHEAERDDNYIVVAELRDEEGVEHTVSLNVAYEVYEQSEHAIKVVYPPGQPTEAEAYDFESIYTRSVLGLVLTVGFGLWLGRLLLG